VNYKLTISPVFRFLPFAFYLLLFICFLSCKEKVEYQNNECKRQPPFVKAIGFNPGKSALSTSEKTIPGLVLIEVNAGGINRKYQHPTWKMTGSAGPIQLDDKGNCFVGPVPVINVLNNPPQLQNRIYKVDGNSGEMKLFAELPVADSIPNTNAYGILGFAFLCESNTLYVSTVQGSDRLIEKGIVYALDAVTGSIKDKITGIDILGMGISYSPGQRTLYMGSARTSDIFSVVLKKDGTFKGKPGADFSLTDLGPRGDDKVRRIRFNQFGIMQVYGVEFNFNLTAPTEKQETVYEFIYNDENRKWLLKK
jgi:hypothetical protein